jgi:2-polyprenyl-6-methoxyphenol hydroxylase-like FAD-dependent oxidoreductase
MTYDAIVLGARCAGSPTAMLLARQGHKVLVVDRATFPSDTISTHLVQPLAALALTRWGLLEKLTATGCPPIHTCAMDFGPFSIVGSPGNAASPNAYCARRIVLDKLLVDAAREAGAEIREGVTVERLIVEGGRVVGIEGHSKDGRVSERAHVVIGADGRNSLVAQTVHPEEYQVKGHLACCYYAYYSGLPMNGRMEVYIAPGRGFAALPTHDDQTLVLTGWSYADFEENKKDLEGSFEKVIAMVPAFAERLHAAKRESRLAGAAVPNFVRKPYGPGWALVGDAGCTKDPITAQGIKDAFDDAELCTQALHRVFADERPFDEAMGEYHRARDARLLPMYEVTCHVAMLQPPAPDMQKLFTAMQGDRAAMDAFIRVNAGTTPPGEFFAPDHIAGIMARAASRPRSGTGALEAQAPRAT